MFNLSEGDLNKIQNETAPGTLRALEEKLLELAMENDPKKFLSSLDNIRNYALIELAGINMKNIYTAVEALQSYITPAIFEADKRVADDSIKKKRGVLPTEVVVTDAQKEANRLANQERERIFKEKKDAEIEAKRLAKESEEKQTKEIKPDIELNQIENAFKPKSKLEILRAELEAIFSIPEISLENLFANPEIREILLQLTFWKKRNNSKNIEFDLSATENIKKLEADLYMLITINIMKKEITDIMENRILPIKYDDKIVKNELLKRTFSLMNQLESKTKLYATTEEFAEQKLEQKQKEKSTLMKIADSVKNYLLGGHLF
jgi:hypothetical protein